MGTIPFFLILLILSSPAGYNNKKALEEKGRRRKMDFSRREILKNSGSPQGHAFWDEGRMEYGQPGESGNFFAD